MEVFPGGLVGFSIGLGNDVCGLHDGGFGVCGLYAFVWFYRAGLLDGCSWRCFRVALLVSCVCRCGGGCALPLPQTPPVTPVGFTRGCFEPPPPTTPPVALPCRACVPAAASNRLANHFSRPQHSGREEGYLESVAYMRLYVSIVQVCWVTVRGGVSGWPCWRFDWSRQRCLWSS